MHSHLDPEIVISKSMLSSSLIVDPPHIYPEIFHVKESINIHSEIRCVTNDEMAENKKSFSKDRFGSSTQTMLGLTFLY